MKRLEALNLIPQELEIKILLLLPFESILTCKLVSKEWRNFFTDPNFFNLYHAKSSMSLFLYNDDLCCLIIRPHKNKIPNTIQRRWHPPFTVHRVPINLRRSIWWECPSLLHCKLLSGSSKVVACVCISGVFRIYNLLNGDFFTVEGAPQPFSSWVCFGFGYEPYANDYKVVVVQKRKGVEIEDNTILWVYSAKNNAWNQLKDSPFPYNWNKQSRREACSFNGVLHWLVTSPKSENNPVIVTYDLRTCRFGEILLPFDCQLGYHVPMIGALDEQLCGWKFFNNPDRFELWVMKEESWTTVISSSRAAKRFKGRHRHLVTPTGTYECRNGRKGVLFVSGHDGSLYWFDVCNEEIKATSRPKWSKRGQRQRQEFEYIKMFL